jgi:hypothetical protein
MPSDTTSTSTHALALLTLPAFDELTDNRRRGAECVWTGRPLTGGTAIDLGERQASDGTLWFPRACRAGVLREAMAALHTHSQACLDCQRDYRACEQGYGLLRLVKEMR